MAKSDSGIEKRRHPRVRVEKSVRAKADGREHSGSVTDISASGSVLHRSLRRRGREGYRERRTCGRF